LGAEHVLEIAAREPRIDAGRLPVDDVLPRRRLAGRAAERGGERAGDDLDPFPRGQARRLGGNRGGIGAVTDREDQLPAHHAAEAAVDEVAHDLVALEVELALDGEIAGERLQHPDLVLAAGLLLSLHGADAERQRDQTNDRPLRVPHAPALLSMMCRSAPDVAALLGPGVGQRQASRRRRRMDGENSPRARRQQAAGASVISCGAKWKSASSSGRTTSPWCARWPRWRTPSATTWSASPIRRATRWIPGSQRRSLPR